MIRACQTSDIVQRYNVIPFHIFPFSIPTVFDNIFFIFEFFSIKIFSVKIEVYKSFFKIVLVLSKTEPSVRNKNISRPLSLALESLTTDTQCAPLSLPNLELEAISWTRVVLSLAELPRTKLFPEVFPLYEFVLGSATTEILYFSP